MRIWQMLVALGLILSSGIGLLIMSGNARAMFAPRLQAELVVQDFPLPPDVGVDPAVVADFMAKELQRRLGEDVAIRLTLPGATSEKVRDIVLPRLMNVVAVQAMMDGIPELSALLEMGSIRQTVSGDVFSTATLADVALTVPGAFLASVDGTLVDVTTTSTGLTALSLGDMAAGQSIHVVLWLGETAEMADLGRSVRLGAADGLRGRVLMSGDRGWFGADIEAMRWARWLIGSVLVSVLIFGLASLLFLLFGGGGSRRRYQDAQAAEKA